jgi:Arc/MetJ-type ribon-helix-helix transcriptional regulator
MLRTMEVRIVPTPEQEAFIKEGIASGRFQSAEDAARQALLQWEEYQRRRATLLLELDCAEASLARGEGYVLDSAESIQEFIEDIKREGRAEMDSTR